MREHRLWRRVMLLASLIWLAPTLALNEEKSPVVPETAAPAAKAGPTAEDMGTLLVELSGNRRFCVDRNEIAAKPGAVKPRQNRNSPLVTTLGYKYQISASRRGTTSIIKLMESPTIRTAYVENQIPKKSPPQPRLATPKDISSANQPFRQRNKVTRWIPEGTCTTLVPHFSFPLAPGHYDVYLGFDVLLKGGQWVPLQSDYVTDVTIEKGVSTRVNGRVDYTDGIRTVKMESSQKPSMPPKR